MEKQIIEPVAVISSDYKEKFGIPRNGNRAPSSVSKIVFTGKYNNPDAVRGIEQFSHIWLIFDFSLSHTEKFSATVRPPRLGGNKRIGVFASRSPFRPNSIGLSCVKLLGVENTNGQVSLSVSGADLLDGTPIYDIKPYIPFSDCIQDAKGGFAEENKNHKLSVIFPQDLISLIPTDKIDAVKECLSDDPRPAYQNDDRVYGMKFSDFNIKFSVKDGVLTVIKVTKE